MRSAEPALIDRTGTGVSHSQHQANGPGGQRQRRAPQGRDRSQVRGCPPQPSPGQAAKSLLWAGSPLLNHGKPGGSVRRLASPTKTRVVGSGSSVTIRPRRAWPSTSAPSRRRQALVRVHDHEALPWPAPKRPPSPVSHREIPMGSARSPVPSDRK
jgi:hypothetical protein